MANAMLSALRTYARVVLIGTDAPCVNAAEVEQGFEALTNKDVVLQPAEDGGYVLVGMRAPGFAIFEGIEWGSDSVMAGTRQLLQQLQLDHHELATAWDIDEPEDLARFRQWQQSAVT